jgi:hypothetical protein
VSDRPPIPIAIQREVLTESCHRCAVCCEPLPLEKAHIRPWSTSHSHAAENLVALCANCHQRADGESWGPRILEKYKRKPCALLARAMPPVSPEQQAMVDLIISANPDSMTDIQRQRLVSMVAAYAGVVLHNVEIVFVEPENSSRIRLRLPTRAATRLEQGFRDSDPLLRAFLEDFELVRLDPVAVEQASPVGPAEGQCTGTVLKYDHGEGCGLIAAVLEGKVVEVSFQSTDIQDGELLRPGDRVAFDLVTTPEAGGARKPPSLATLLRPERERRGPRRDDDKP